MYRGAAAIEWISGLILASAFHAVNADTPSTAGAVREVSGHPSVSIHVSGNRSFYWNNRRLRYLVVTMDPGVGDSLHATLAADRTAVHFGYVNGESPLPAGFFAAGGLTADVSRGEAIVHRADCLLCHTIDGANVVPSLTAIARSSGDDASSRSTLATVIAKGSATAIGGIQMPPHPSLNEAEINSVTAFILTLRDADKNPRLVSAAGEVLLNEHPFVAPSGGYAPAVYVLTAAYRRPDVRANDAPTSVAELRLRSPRLSVEEVNGSNDVQTASIANVGPVKVAGRAGAYVYFDNIDLSGVSVIEVMLADDAKRTANGGRVVLRVDGLGGPTLGEAEIGEAHGSDSQIRLPIAIRRSEGFHRLYVVAEDSASRKAQASFAALELFPGAEDGYE